jgi:hypothetical protein
MTFTLTSALSPNILITSDSPFPLVPSVSLNPIISIKVPSNTIMPLHPSLDLNNNPDVHKIVSEHFLYKTLDVWLYDELSDLLNYLVVEGTKVRLIKNLDEYKSDRVDSDTLKNIELKTDWINRYILTIDKVRHVLKKYVQETNTNWSELHKNSYFVRDAIKHYLKRKLKNAVKEQGSK